jgi:hypothetical protein
MQFQNKDNKKGERSAVDSYVEEGHAEVSEGLNHDGHLVDEGHVRHRFPTMFSLESAILFMTI